MKQLVRGILAACARRTLATRALRACPLVAALNMPLSGCGHYFPSPDEVAKAARDASDMFGGIERTAFYIDGARRFVTAPDGALYYINDKASAGWVMIQTVGGADRTRYQAVAEQHLKDGARNCAIDVSRPITKLIWEFHYTCAVAPTR